MSDGKRLVHQIVALGLTFCHQAFSTTPMPKQRRVDIAQPHLVSGPRIMSAWALRTSDRVCQACAGAAHYQLTGGRRFALNVR
ncbi:hypothetical protein C8Q70DRAFT_955708 [Cubamyces menziesii]|nr:hypothetical protein C8Q70DRAFT_955708 [Cubamyces menziesii]